MLTEVQQLLNIFESATIEKQVEIRADIYDLKNSIDNYFDDNLYACAKCAKHFPLGNAISKFEIWSEEVCKNPFGGYLDEYEYETETFSGFRYYCPHCKQILPNYYQTKCYKKGKQY